MALIHGGVVAVLQQLAALPGDVLIGVRCCYRAVVSSLRILLLLAAVVSTALRAVATAEPDDDDEQDEKDDADASGDAHQNLRGQEVRCGLGLSRNGLEKAKFSDIMHLILPDNKKE